jgi:exodeoxyribonuclease V alpha subunit
MSMPQRATASAATEVLAGLVERVTFHNEENGFCVLRVKARGQRDLITVLGHAAMISAGEFVQASGAWINDRIHGVQFRASFLKVAAPTTVEGIEKYLGSGMIRGIGPVYAKKLVRAFGEKVFEIIEQEPARLREVTGIGPKRAAQIIAGWAEQKVIREIMLFLHSNGVGTSRAVRIYKTYGADAVQLISENPYRLARDIRGIGFVTADQIAAKLGIEKTALIRVRAGISYALAEAMDEGHCGLPADELIPLTQKLLGVPADLVENGARDGAGREYGHCRSSRGPAVHLPRSALSRRTRDRRTASGPGERKSTLAMDRSRKGDPLGRDPREDRAGR